MLLFLDEWGGGVEGVPDPLADLHGRGREGHFGAERGRDGEQIVEQPRQVQDLAVEDGYLLVALEAPPDFDQVQRRPHRSQRVSQLVAHDGEKLLFAALAFLRTRESDAFPLGVDAIGQIARDLAEAEQTAALVANRGDDDVGPKRRPVLPDTPPLVLEAALARGDLELVLAFAGLHVLSRI